MQLAGDRQQVRRPPFPYLEIKNTSATVEHEASTSKIDEDQNFYCRQRGLSTEDAVNLMVRGFCQEVFRELPMEFAAEKLLRFHGELHRQLAEDFLAEAVDDHVDRVFRRDAALAAVENLVLADLRRRRLVLDLGRRVLDFDDTGTCARRTCRRCSSESHCE